jgi:di/tricarboxylate transporter
LDLLILLIGLVVTGILTPAEAFSGFSGDIIVILVFSSVYPRDLTKRKKYFGIMSSFQKYQT